MSAPRVVILGATGGVGRAAAAMLREWTSARLCLASRDAGRARAAIGAGPGDPPEVAAVDIKRPEALKRVVSGCDVVLNCAGPSCQFLEQVALAASAAGANYVDPGGGELYHMRLRSAFGAAGKRTAVLSAGMTPGLSGVLLRALAEGFTRCDAAEVFAGGCGPLTPAAAEDYLTAGDARVGEARAAWRDGQAVPHALHDRPPGELPHFPGVVSAHPYLSREAVGIAHRIGLRDLSWYVVFDGEQLPATLTRGPGSVTGRDVQRAAALDSAGRSSYQLFVLQLAGRRDDTDCWRTVVARGSDASLITGAVAAFTAAEILVGRIAAGTHFAADVLDPQAVLHALRERGVISVLQLESTEPDTGAPVEEGAL